MATSETRLRWDPSISLHHGIKSYAWQLQWQECCASPNSYVEIRTPKVIVLGGGAFGKWLGHQGGAFMNRINAITTIYNIVSVEKMLSAFQTTELDMTFGIQFIS